MAWWWWLAPLAGAAEPETAEEPARVLVTTLQRLPPGESADAEILTDLEQALRNAFDERHTLVSLEDVPPFRVHGYGPELYMESCPPGRYSGCAYVLGQRVGAPWAVGGTLERRTDSFDGSTFDVFEVVLIDVERSVEVARFTVDWTPSDQASIVEGVVQLFDELRMGTSDPEDLREDGSPAGLDEAGKARIADSLRRLEDAYGIAIKAEVTVREPEKVTRSSLDAFRRSEGPTPWSRLDMSESEYVRFANSGQDVGTWRRAAKGRQGQLLVRLLAGTSTGPWHQNVEGELLRSGFDLQAVHTVQYVEAIRGGSAVGGVELGFGVLPFLDVSGIVTRRSGRATVVRDEDVKGQAAIPTDPETIQFGTTQWGARVTAAPLWLHQVARPVFIAGVYGWRGRSVPGTVSFPSLEAPRLVVGELQVGGEVDTSSSFGLTARLGLDVPLSGQWFAVTNDGAGIESPPQPTLERPLGWSLQLGVQVRAALIGRRRP